MGGERKTTRRGSYVRRGGEAGVRMYVPQKKVKSNQRTRRLADVLPQPWYKQQAPGNPDESPALALLISRGEKKRKTGEDDEPMQMAVCMYGRMYGVMIGVINFRDLETQSRENFLSPFFLFLFFFSFLFFFFRSWYNP